MSLTTILTFLLLILACVLPVIFMRRRNEKAQQGFLKILFDHASLANDKISQYDLINNQVIGISDSGNTVFFLKRRKDKDVIKQVSLKETEACYINNTTRSSVDGNYSSTEKLELRFTPGNKSNPDVVFELYNLESDSLSMNGELQMAEKWRSIINDRLKISRGKS